MSTRLRILRKVGIGLAILVVAGAIAAILIVRTDWFRQFVRQKVIAAVEEGTGGRADIGSFSFDWTRLRAGFTDFVIHGSEPAGAAPYLHARRIEIGLRFFTNLKLLGVTDLEVDRPEANILVAADGSTNVPQPRRPSSSNTAPLETVVDLAVGHFDLANGSVSFNSHKQDFDLHGDNLHVQLWYDSLKQGYRGDISLAPIYVIAGRNRPVNLEITLPLVLERDRIEFRNGQIATNASHLAIDGSIENLRNPRTTAHIQGRVALADLKNGANLPIAPNARGAPSAVDLDVDATVSDNIVDVAGSRIVLGQSFIQASGRLRDPAGHGRLQFRSRLAIGELGRLAQVAVRPEGTAQINGTATLEGNGNYDVEARAEASGVSFQQGARRIAHVSLTSPVHLTPRRLDLTGFRLVALGAEVGGHATLEDFARYTIEANLSRLDLRTLAHEVGGKDIAYDGIVSGLLKAAGDVRAPGANGVTAHARLSIAPGHQGVPVSGRLNADYLGDRDNLTITASYLALPHSRLTFNGSLGQQLNVALDTRDLRDFSPLTGTPPPVVLSGRPATFAGAVTGSLRSPRIAAHLSLSRFAVDGRQFDALEADLAASGSRAAVSAGTLQRGAMQARFNGTVGLSNWDAAPDQPVSAQASIRNADLADLLALAGVAPEGYAGALNADASVAGTIANPRGSANLTVANGTLRGEPFDSLQAQANLSGQLVTVSGAHVAAGQSRIDLAAEFRHPRDSFATGQLHAHVRTTPVDLAQLHAVETWRPHTAGTLQLDADVTGDLRPSTAPGAPPEFVPVQVAANASGRGLRVRQQSYGDFTATARTSGQTVNYTASSNFAGSEIRVSGATQLAPGYHTNADASIGGLPIERVVSLLRPDLPAKGTLSATAHFTGTVDHPEGSLDVTVDHGVFYDEPIDHARARVNYLAGAIEVPQVEVRSGPSAIELDARYDHPAGALQSGNLQFHVRNGHVDLARIHNVQKLRPGLAGTLQLTGSGAATVREAEPRVLARDVNLNIRAMGIAAQGKDLGDLTLTANSSGGSVQVALNSNLAGASLNGQGSAQLSGDYPIQAKMTFQNIAWKRLQPLLGAGNSPPPDFDASIDGQIAVSGPALRTSDLSGRLQLSRVQLRAAPPARPGSQQVAIENQGPVAVSLDKGMVRIESLHLAGSGTDLKASGNVSLQARTMEATVTASANLDLLQRLQRDVVSSGEIVADATVRGTFDKPLINGKVELRKASLNDINFPTGISNASGAIQFNGNSASVRDVTAEVGGGKLTLGGLLTYSGQMRFAVHATAKNVRLFLQPGVSTVADADLRLNGRAAASVLSGTVTIDQITYAPQSDFASILSRAAPSVESQTPSQLLDTMKLDVQLRTSSATAVQASLAENLQTDANLRIQGTASQPSVLGRINVNQGKLLFFSSSYTVNSGSISFYNPIRIDPILDLSMETQTKGVNVVLHVTGPVDNMKLSYTSDPPLQFQEILGLLAAGQVPTSDPTLLANQPVQPAQSFQQMGESAVLSKALADPVANQLQRVFGVSQLKINPSFNSGSDLPQVQVALQQKVTNQLTLTYMTTVDNPSTQVVSGEWALNRQWSATATRNEFGLFSIELLYKKQLR